MAERYVDHVMSRPAETVSPDASLREAAERLIERDVGAVVVVDRAGRLEGLLTATDFVQALREGTAPDATVGDVMRTDVVTTTRGTPLAEVAATMVEHLIHHVPVVEGGEVVGMVTTLDLTAHLARSA